MPSRHLVIDTFAALAALACLAALPAIAQEAGAGIRTGMAANERLDLASGPLEPEDELRGAEVVSADGARLGTVARVAASASGQGRFLVIGGEGTGSGRYLPVPEYRIARIGADRLQVLAPDTALSEAPRFAEADFADGPGGWPEGLEVWWLERLEGPELKPRPRPEGRMIGSPAALSEKAVVGRTDATRKY